MSEASPGRIFEIIKAQKKEALNILRDRDARNFMMQLTHKEKPSVDQLNIRAEAYDIAERVIDDIIEIIENGGKEIG